MHGTSVKEVPWATQGCLDLCFGGFSTYGEPNRLLSSIQPSSATEETGPILVNLLWQLSVVGNDACFCSCALSHICETDSLVPVCGDTSPGCPDKSNLATTQDERQDEVEVCVLCCHKCSTIKEHHCSECIDTHTCGNHIICQAHSR